MKNILFPTDFSEAARHAFIYALKIADSIGAKITTLHVSDIPQLELEGPAKSLAIDQIHESMQMEEFESYRDSVIALKAVATKEHLEHVHLQHIMEAGKVKETILKVANENNIDLIIMGTKGAGWLKEIFFGTISSEILEKANCPVLTVPKNAIFDGVIDKIAVTTEFKEEEIEVIQKVLAFADLFNAQVQCINVDLSHTEYYAQRMDKLKKEFEGVDNISFVVLDGLDLIYDLATYLENNAFDMVVMTVHKRSFIEELFAHSRVKAMTYQQNIPVYAIPAHIIQKQDMN